MHYPAVVSGSAWVSGSALYFFSLMGNRYRDFTLILGVLDVFFSISGEV